MPKVKRINKGGSPVKVIDVDVFMECGESASFVCPCTSVPMSVQGMMYFEQYDGSASFININYIEQIDVGRPRDPKPEEYTECR